MSVIIISGQVTSLPRWSSMHCSNFSIYAAGLLLYHLLRQLVQTAGLLTDVFSSLELCFQPVWSPDCMCLIFQVFGKYNRSFKSLLILPDFPLILIVSVISHALKVKHCFTNSTQQNRLFQNKQQTNTTNKHLYNDGSEWWRWLTSHCWPEKWRWSWKADCIWTRWWWPHSWFQGRWPQTLVYHTCQHSPSYSSTLFSTSPSLHTRSIFSNQFASLKCGICLYTVIVDISLIQYLIIQLILCDHVLITMNIVSHGLINI